MVSWECPTKPREASGLDPEAVHAFRAGGKSTPERLATLLQRLGRLLIEEVRFLDPVVVLAFEHVRRRRAHRRQQPRTVAGDVPVGGAFVLLEPLELVGHLVVVDDLYAGLLEGVQHGTVQHQERLVLPKRAAPVGVQPQPFGDRRKEVIAVLVGEVSGSDLRRDVPAAERRRGVVDPADLESHVRDNRHVVPAQVQLLEPLVLGVAQSDLADRRLGDLEQLGFLIADPDDVRQDVEPPAVALPTPRPTVLGEPDLVRVADDAVVGPVAGVAQQLVVPDPDLPFAVDHRLEHREQRDDVAVVSGPREMSTAGFVDLPRGLTVAGVGDFEPLPEQSADTAVAVPPGHLRAVFEFGGRVFVVAAALDLGFDFPQSIVDLRLAVEFGVTPLDERPGLREQFVPIVRRERLVHTDR